MRTLAPLTLEVERNRNAATPLLKALPLHFIGNVEGRDIYSGLADVVVCARTGPWARTAPADRHTWRDQAGDWVELSRKLAVRLLEGFLVRVAGNLKHFVVVPLGRHS